MISIVIPTFNAGQRFDELLKSIEDQTLKPAKIIVIDSESTDQTVAIAESRGCKIITIDRADFDHGTTRNLAVSYTNSEYLVFLTQDAIPADEHMIEELITPLQTDPSIAVCYGQQLARPDARPLERFARKFNYPDISILKTKHDIKMLGLKTFFCSNSCSAYRRDIFEKLGGFKKNVIVNEDMHFAARAILVGYSVYYSAEAKVYHSHSYSMSETFKRYFNIGRFFADNKWILESAGLKQYGGGMLKAGIKTFYKKRMPQYILVLFAEFAVKTCACMIGKYYQLLLHFIRR